MLAVVKTLRQNFGEQTGDTGETAQTGETSHSAVFLS